MKNSQDHFDYFYSYAERLANDIAEMRMMDIDELKIKIRVQMLLAFQKILETSIDDLEGMRNKLWRKAESEVPNGYERQKLQDKLSVIKGELHQKRKSLNSIREFNEYTHLKQFVRDKYGNDVLKEFFKSAEEYQKNIQ